MAATDTHATKEKQFLEVVVSARSVARIYIMTSCHVLRLQLEE
jgi:hypothetical protein